MNQHRDSIASYIGHNNMLEFFAIAENECKARVKFNLQKVWSLLSIDKWTFKILVYGTRWKGQLNNDLNNHFHNNQKGCIHRKTLVSVI